MSQKRLFVDTLVILALGLGGVFCAGCSNPPERPKRVPPSETPSLRKLLDLDKVADPITLSARKVESEVSFDEADKIPLHLKEQCARDLCGDPRSAIGSAKDISDFLKMPESQESAAFFEQKARPLLEQKISLDIEKEQKAVAWIEANRDRFSSLRLSKEYTAIMHILRLIVLEETIEPAIQTRMVEGLKYYSLDPAELAKVLPKMSVAERDFLREIFEDFRNDPLFQYGEQFQSTPFTEIALHYARNSGNEPKNAAKAFGTYLLNGVVQLHKLFPELDFAQSAETLTDLKNGGEVLPERLSVIASAFFANALYKIVTQKLALYSRIEISVSDLAAEALQSPHMQGLAKYSDAALLAQVKAKFFDQCRDIVSQVHNTIPTREEDKTIKERIPQIKASALKTAKKLTTNPQELALLEKHLSATNFVLPANKEQTMSNLLRRMQLEVQRAEDQIRNANKWTPSSAFILLYAGVGFQKTPAKLVSRACRELAPQALTEKVYTSSGQVYVSWTSLKLPTYGIGVLAHELGHVAYSLMSSQQPKSAAFTSLGICTAKRHLSGPTQDTKDEDFADFIAAKVVADLQKKGVDGGNFGCMLMGKNDSRWGVRGGLSLEFPPRITDPHSTDFHRALQVQLHSGKAMPASCDALIDNHAPMVKAACTLQ